MPIKVQGELPARETLERENVFTMDENRAIHQDIRPIEVGILNLMPLKEDTELQILRELSNTPLQVDVTFVTVGSHASKNTSSSHLNKFYHTFQEVKAQKFDGFIISGNLCMDGEQRNLYHASVLGGPSCPILSLRHSQGKAFPENVRPV